MTTAADPKGAEHPPTPSGGGGVGGAVLALLRALGHACASGWRRLHAWNRRGGAGASGLARLTEIHALQSGGDATVAVALAGTLFFGAATQEARWRVALYLLITMAPFAVLAPLLGPLLDRFQHGRRFAVSATMAARAVLAIVIGHNLATGATHALALYPAALGVLIAGKAYGIARSAAVPRLLPPGLTLVQANSRLTLVSVLAPGVAGGIAIGIAHVFDTLMALRFGAVLYVVAAVLALRLPRSADGAVAGPESAAGRGLLHLDDVDPAVRLALRLTVALRWLSGFLLLYGAFVLRTHRLSGLSHNLSLTLLAVGIGVGNLIGTTVAARYATHPTRQLAPAMLGVNVAAALWTALDFGLLSVAVLAVTSSAAAATAKLNLDATIQTCTAESVRTSTFARSETALQLGWVVGGAVGIILPTLPVLGFLAATVVLGAALADVVGLHVPLPHRAR